MRRRAREKQKEEDRRPIVKKLRAALLRSYREQHDEKMICVRGVPGVTGTLGKANRHFHPTQTYDRNFAFHYSGLESICILGTNRRSVLMIRVKVNSKSLLVQDSEGKSALYRVICCCGDRLLS